MTPINLLHSTTALTSPQQTFELHEATKKIIAEASQKVGNTFHVHPYYREGIRLSPSPEYYLRETETDINTPPLFYS